MGMAYIPTHVVTSFEVGSTSIVNPYPMLVINDIAYPAGYRVNFAGGYRNFYATYDPANSKIYITCIATAFGEDLGDYTLTNAYVYIIGGDNLTTSGGEPVAGTITYVNGAHVNYQYTTDGYGNINWQQWDISLSWNPVAYANKYRIYHWDGAGWVFVVEVASNSWSSANSGGYPIAAGLTRITVIDIYGHEVNPYDFTIT